jgi:uncharacterized phage-associated protein
MSEVLGMGANTWSNYENGEVPSKVHANLIQMIDSPETFRQLISKNGELAEKNRKKILKTIEALDQPECNCDDELKKFVTDPNIFSGYKSFQSEKVSQMALFLAENQQPYKTKLNKLLWYADNYQFRNHAQSISGFEYVAIKYGPVPNQYEYLYEALVEKQIISKEATMTQNGEVEQIIPFGEHKFDPSLFSESELDALKYIAEKFKDTNAKEIAELSHQEKAWKDNIEGRNKISFMYAFDLVTI